VDTSATPETAPADEVTGDVGSEEATSATPARRRRARKGLNILSVLALVLALTASPLAVIFGYISIGQIRRADQRGAAMAWTAVALGWLWLVVYVVVIGAVITIYVENPFWP